MSGGLPEVEPPTALRRNLMRAAYGEATPARAPKRRAAIRASLTRRRLVSLGGAAVTVAAVAVAVVVLLRPPAATPRTYTVVGSTSAPDVQGALTYYTDQQQGVLTVNGLPALETPSGAAPPVYEVWLIPSGGAPRGIAFLTQSPVSHAWTTVIHTDLTRYATVAATEEPAGGSPAPTGAQLFSVQMTR